MKKVWKGKKNRATLLASLAKTTSLDFLGRWYKLYSSRNSNQLAYIPKTDSVCHDVLSVHDNSTKFSTVQWACLTRGCPSCTLCLQHDSRLQLYIRLNKLSNERSPLNIWQSPTKVFLYTHAKKFWCNLINFFVVWFR